MQAAAPSVPASESILNYVVYVVLIVAVIYGVYLAMSYYKNRGSTGSSNLSGSGTVHDAASPHTFKSSEVPGGTQTQGQYGIQLWGFIKDWGYKYGQEKTLFARSDSSGNVNPEVVLHPTDNSAIVRVSYLPRTPGEVSYEKFECIVPNIPLQSWFSLSVSLNNTNMDVYMNGYLVKSCAIPGVPLNIGSDIVLSKDGGFSGSVSDLTYSNTSLSPTDALTYYKKGSTAPGASSSPSGGLNRYKLQFNIVDKSTDKEIKSYSL